MAKKLNDLNSLGLLLIGIFIFILSLRETGFTKLAGLLGGIVLIITQIAFLWQLKIKK